MSEGQYVLLQEGGNNEDSVLLRDYPRCSQSVIIQDIIIKEFGFQKATKKLQPQPM
jgi:hypothetical protein